MYCGILVIHYLVIYSAFFCIIENLEDVADFGCSPSDSTWKVSS